MKNVILILSLSGFISCARLDRMIHPNTFIVRPQSQYMETNRKVSISEEFANPQNLATFKKALCSKMNQTDCLVKYYTTAVSRMREKYSEADLERIKIKCDAHPIECQQMTYLEKLFIDSNDEVIEQKDSIAKAEQSQAKKRKALLILNAFNQGYDSAKPVTTTCNPNGFGGVSCQSN